MFYQVCTGIISFLCGLALAIVLWVCLGPRGVPVTGAPFDPNAPRFPTVSGENLNRRTIQIPAGLDAPYSVLLVAFSREQQSDVDTWLPTVKDIVRDHSNVEYYELPTVSGLLLLTGRWLDDAMRGGIPKFADRERTVTLYTNTEEFRKLAGIDSPRQIWVGLVDRDGRVYWSTRGPASETTVTELQLKVHELSSPAADQKPEAAIRAEP